VSEKPSQLIKETKREFFCFETEKVCDIVLKQVQAEKVQSGSRSRAVRELSLAAFNKIKAVIVLIKNLCSEDALILWRSLYELENILSLIAKSSNEAADEYYRFRTTKNIADEQKKLKMERRCGVIVRKGAFKNYGWIHKVEGFNDNVMIAFNGVEKLAKLDRKNDYDYVSEYVHAARYNSEENESFRYIIQFLVTVK
jgi:hypothetical protein